MTTLTHYPLATIPATEVRTLHAAAVNQDYQISVALPFHYHTRPEQTYPVIYVLDANLNFALVVEMVRAMNIRVPFCNELPDAIIVGIGYPVSGSLAESHAQVMHLRMRDFLPLRDEGAERFIQEMFPVADRVASGGADRFLQFIQRDLVPLIEANYRADTAGRTLLGHSWGGLFALYALFQQPDLFQRYVAISPDLPHGQGAILDDEQRFAARHDSLAVRLYLAYGEPELNDYEWPFLERFLSALESRRYAGFQLTYQTFPNCTHCAVVAPAFQAGLVAVFA
ncbi:MAG: alpha/beta hydrolase [Caldilineales bacterium]|nr:alpha/beta hydrolase [Caldilineales bacterium]